MSMLTIDERYGTFINNLKNLPSNDPSEMHPVSQNFKKYLVFFVYPSGCQESVLVDSRLMAYNMKDAQERAHHIYMEHVIGECIEPEEDQLGEFLCMPGIGKHNETLYYTLVEPTLQIEVQEVP